MEMIGVDFTVCPARKEEKPDLSLGVGKAIEKVALAKAEDVYRRNPDALVLGSDTVVVSKGRIFGKPLDGEDAGRMLRSLSGTVHEVVTGYAFVSAEETYSGFEATKVKFAELSGEEIDWYVHTEEPYDKAGAYAIQGKSAVFVEGIEGDVYTVIGLPVRRVYEYLRKKGYLERRGYEKSDFE